MLPVSGQPLVYLENCAFKARYIPMRQLSPIIAEMGPAWSYFNGLGSIPRLFRNRNILNFVGQEEWALLFDQYYMHTCLIYKRCCKTFTSIWQGLMPNWNWNEDDDEKLYSSSDYDGRLHPHHMSLPAVCLQRGRTGTNRGRKAERDQSWIILPNTCSPS